MKLNLHVVQCATTVLSCQVSMDTLCQALTYLTWAIQYIFNLGGGGESDPPP